MRVPGDAIGHCLRITGLGGRVVANAPCDVNREDGGGM